MNYLSDYTAKAQSELLKETGAFFAFSNQQFDEARTPGVEYVSLTTGLICPKDQAKTLWQGLEEIQQAGMKVDLEENGRVGVILRELGNHECQITGDITDAVDCLTPYGITREEVQAQYPAFFENCVKNDYF